MWILDRSKYAAFCVSIFSNRSGVCKTKLLQDTPLISLVCALLVIDGMIVTLWTMLDPMERHLKNLTIEISATDRSVVYQPQVSIFFINSGFLL